MSAPSGFVHLHTHSAFSLSEGALKIPELVTLCQKYQMPALALTDTNNLFGALSFSLSCAKAGIQPIVGCQLALHPGADDPRLSRKKAFAGPEEILTDTLVLLAQSQVGYEQLMALSTAAFRRAYKEGTSAHITFEDLEHKPEGLIALSGGMEGGVSQLLKNAKDSEAEAYSARLKKLFGDRFYIQVARQGRAGEAGVEEKVLDLAYDQKVPLVATNEAFFGAPDMREAHDALLCIAGGNYVSQDNRRKSNEHFDFKSSREMLKRFEDLPEAIENTLVIAQRCSYFLEEKPPQLPPFATEKGEVAELKSQAEEGLQKRLEEQVFPENKDLSESEKEALVLKYKKRLSHELQVIEEMGYPGYFLIVSDFIKWALEQGIPVGPGRGSGAGSLVAWSLVITDIDPLRFSLIFERFLNQERVSMPDFDVDFCQERRDEVIGYVQERYGCDRVAQIITFGKLQARAVVRDVGRVLQMPYGQVDRLSKMIPNNPANPVTLQEALDQEADMRMERRRDASVDRLLSMALKLEGLYRHASTHAAGVVIAGGPLEKSVALYYDPRSEMPATQFNMKDVEKVGLVKFDFLGLKTLTVIVDTLKLLQDRGISLKSADIPLDDKKTFEFLKRVETIGIFQLESAGMRDVLRQLQPDRFEEIIALVALYRPGPMDDIPRYLACKHGREPVVYPDPMVEGILKETFGVMVYQEQVMHIAQKMAGYTLGGADILRRAMGKKIKAEMDAQRKIFVEGSEKNGVNKKKASEIFDQVAKFAGYGFNKSHSAPYALISYQTAYLKANYPVEFMAATMTHDRGNTDKMNILVQEVSRLGLPLLLPDINKSQVIFSVEEVMEEGEKKSGVRYALSALKNVGDAAMEQVIAERNKNGDFKNITDFARRLDSKVINRRQMDNLICAGAFDSLYPNRRQLSESLDQILLHAGANEAERQSNQISLFGGGGGEGKDTSHSVPEVRLVDVPPWDGVELSKKEFQSVGFYLSFHPLTSYKEALEQASPVTADRLFKFLCEGPAESFTMAGVIVSKQERTSAKSGKRFAFLSMSDETGSFEVAVFSEQLSVYRDVLEPGSVVLLTLSGRLDSDEPRLTLQDMSSLSALDESPVSRVTFKVQAEQGIEQLQSFLNSGSEGETKTRVELILEGGAGVVKLRLKKKYALTPKSLRSVGNHHDFDYVA
ncbi:MAG: DNA polymerase III subunit alpha [bacterium]|nr:DNA polymerase III subunit alpha [bacterium]